MFSNSERLLRSALVSLFLHVFLFFLYLLFATDAFYTSTGCGLKPKASSKTYKVTWIKLSKGDGGNNKFANFKKTKNLPDSTIREQKHALKKLTNQKKGQDLRNNNDKTKNSVIEKFSQKRSSDKGGLNIKAKNKTKGQSRIDDALARMSNLIQQRDVNLQAAQTKQGESGQSPWGSSTGSDVDPLLIQYYNTIKRKINREWILSKGDFAGTLKAKIVVLIDADGKIVRSSFKKQSGDGSFDTSAMNAVRRAAPFPIPPQSIKDEAITEGFLIEFNPQRVTGQI